MTVEEYSEAQRAITAAVVALVLRVLEPFRLPLLTVRDWGAILAALYPTVERARRDTAELARRFYDAQRAQHTDAEARHDMLLPRYRPEWFEEALRPARDRLRQSNSTDGVVAQLAMRVAKEIEQAGRRTVLHAVGCDPLRPGWARVATGRETCAFCLMMISRGPVYSRAEYAGLDIEDSTAIQLWRRQDLTAIDELMNRWHPGCDCKAVPVFSRQNWSGRDAYLAAERLWARVTKGYSGKDALNALRRALDAGEIDPADFAAA
ncbi:hypothetical protein GCM10012275_39160 [Longimycelium tulufanense]|uniref:Capsid maturation protease n=1 Tax=Longimycelium tulufanense TaxID=907463 RepID=A0A8J3CEV8_9PSEU|nr:hypothetical protein [Longimycelium tulufanense]GGM64726.1 hypothetical protein GCM10012275_39160 [Longimycelium tulufanense]